ncbi:MAG: DNA methyltransferase, partial [Dehalococcoidia bacterium]|nr:DNA methyltransferase [Dehalococcoidia bacterium]
MTSVASVGASTVSNQEAGPGASPRAALQEVMVRPIPFRVARELLEREHYLHSLPGGTCLALGAFLDSRLKGAITLGVGPYNTPSLVEGAKSDHCLVLTRLWLSDYLPGNSASRTIGLVLRA